MKKKKLRMIIPPLKILTCFGYPEFVCCDFRFKKMFEMKAPCTMSVCVLFCKKKKKNKKNHTGIGAGKFLFVKLVNLPLCPLELHPMVWNS